MTVVGYYNMQSASELFHKFALTYVECSILKLKFLFKHLL